MARQRLHARCHKTNQSGARCKVLVPVGNALRFPRGRKLPFYCDAHQAEILADNAKLALIPRNLEPRTQVVLRHLADKPVADSDTAGYIYALELMDNARPDLIHIKVGRTNDIARRLREHRRNCPSFRPILLGHTAVAPYCDQLERLVHLELTDLAAQSYPPGRNAPRTCCQDCNSVHTEIFTFRRLSRRNQGREWLLIVRPVLERWAHFVCFHLSYAFL